MSTIVALASGAGRSGVAVLRVSGPLARFVLETIAGGCPEPRKAVLRTFRDQSGAVVDSGLVLFFPGPGSFTGEDVAELHGHGSPAVIRRLLQVIVESDADIRLAEPGEFTRRAFLNGKLDLTAAEALGMLIDSDTERQRLAAQDALAGGLSARIGEWRTGAIRMLAEVEAQIDFSDESDVPFGLSAAAMERLAALKTELSALLQRARGSRRLRDGITVAILGAPNAGKSRLFNALVAREAAIVSAIPGTTRDLVEATLEIDGWPLRLVDTAGLRESSDPIEAEGVRRARLLAQGADIALVLDDSVADGVTGEWIRVRTKSDLLEVQPHHDGLPVSAHTGEGLDHLRTRIAEAAAKVCADPRFVVTERQEDLLRRALQALGRASESGLPEEILAEELRAAIRAFDGLSGRVRADDVLGEVFSRFCIGK